MPRPQLRVVLVPAEHALREGGPAGADLGLLAFMFALHALPLVAFAAGGAWGAGIVGYATAVVLLTGRELVHELGACVRRPARGRSR
ncbi:MAG TPA: hypothetical protein VEM76_16145 [Anaeromyxobacteraceae bacterium]|nr:hypothetical protein [Anaeromyxobacteraceae bacterium]